MSMQRGSVSSSSSTPYKNSQPVKKRTPVTAAFSPPRISDDDVSGRASSSSSTPYKAKRLVKKSTPVAAAAPSAPSMDSDDEEFSVRTSEDLRRSSVADKDSDFSDCEHDGDASTTRKSRRSGSSINNGFVPDSLRRVVTSTYRSLLMGDDEPALELSALRYVFSPYTLDWQTDTIKLRVLHPNRPFGHDERHHFFAVEALLEGGTVVPMTAKAIIAPDLLGVSEADYFGEGQCQALCERFVQHYDSLRPRPGAEREKFPLPLLTGCFVARMIINPSSNGDSPSAPPWRVPRREKKPRGFMAHRTSDTGDLLFMLEPNISECRAVSVSHLVLVDRLYEGIEGKRVHTSATPPSPPLLPPSLIGDTVHDTLEAFSHFTFAHSQQQLLVHGLHEHEGYIVSPVVSTADGKSYGLSNRRNKGIREWAEQHTCTSVCRDIGLRPLADLIYPSAAEIGNNYYCSISQHIENFLSCVPSASKLRKAAPTPPKPLGLHPFVMKGHQ